MSDKICNPITKIKNSKQMNEKNYLITILKIEKELLTTYLTALEDASNSNLYEDYHDMFNDISDLQREIYNLLFEKGWNYLEIANEDKINEKIIEMQNQLSQL